MRRVCAGLLLALGLGGCAHQPDHAPRAPSPNHMSAQPVAAVAARRVSNLLNFESNDDLSFIAAAPAGTIRADTSVMREGARSLLIAPSTRSITVKLPTLLEGRPFPADWTLVGGYFYADAPAYITATIHTPAANV